MEYPCISCSINIRPRQQALECDWCNRRQHRTCNSGISIKSYREAVKMGGATFICQQCRSMERPLEPSIQVEVHTSESDGEDPPVLELSVPFDMTFQNPEVEEEPPALESSLPISYIYLEETLVDSQTPEYMQETIDETIEVSHEWEPIADSTAIFAVELGQAGQQAYDGSFDIDSFEDGQDADSFNVENPGSFNISDRNVDVVNPITESSFHDILTETVIEDGGTTFTIYDGCSQKNTKILISSLGYSYGIKRVNQSSIVWRCTSRSQTVKCPVIIKQVGEHFFQKHDHLHPATCDSDLRSNIYNKVRKDSCRQVYRPAMQIVEEAILEYNRPNNTARIKKNLLKRVANRARAALRPQEPKELDFEIDYDFINGEEFVVDDIRLQGQRHIILATKDQLTFLSTAKRWYMDGTFKVVGEPFKKNGQLMSIHAFVEKNGESKQLPLVFCLMSRRTKSDYVAVLRSIVEKISAMHVEGFVLDYEQAAWLAIREVFPDVNIKGCAFHWSQAVWRHVQQVGLAETYRQRLGLHNFVRMLLGLQFLPAAHIQRAFYTLAARASTPETTALIEYVRRQWIDSTIFKIEDWSVFRQLIRTNNDVEGWHHRLNHKAGSCLGFYRLVPLLRREAELVKVAVETGDLQRGSSVRSKHIDKAVASCWDRYMSGEWKTSRFLIGVGEIYSVRT